METMGWTLCAANIEVEEDAIIRLKQFHANQIIEATEDTSQSWLIIDVRHNWLKVKPLFDCYKGDLRKHERFSRMTVDTAFERGFWRIRRKG